VSLAIIQPKL